MTHIDRHEEPASLASCSFATSDLRITGTGRQCLRSPLQCPHGPEMVPLRDGSALTMLATVRTELLGRFELNPLRRGGDGVRVENLSAQSDYQRKKVAHTQHNREQMEREKMQIRFRSEAETHLRVVPIAGDGRCLFRALAKGMAHTKGQFVGGKTEEKDADELRLAVADALCRGPERLNTFKEVMHTIDAIEGGLQRYCTRLESPAFWGGEVEILVLSKMLRMPIHVMQRALDVGREEKGYVPIAKYGEEFEVAKKGRKARKAVKLFYSAGNHYDLLLPSLL